MQQRYTSSSSIVNPHLNIDKPLLVLLSLIALVALLAQLLALFTGPGPLAVSDERETQALPATAFVVR